MNLMLNTPIPAATGPAAQAPAAGAQPVAPGTLDPAAALAQQAAAILPFAQWLGAPAVAGDAAAAQPAAADSASSPDDSAAPDAKADAPADPGAVAQVMVPVTDSPLLAAMAMPIAVAINAAAMNAGADSRAAATAGEPGGAPAPIRRDPNVRAVQPPAMLGAPLAAAAPTEAASAAPQTAAPAADADAGAAAAPVQAARGTAGHATFAAADAGAGQDANAAPAAPNAAGAAPVLHAAPPVAPQPAAADTVTLAGPPTAWRQTLHEALGERLHLQSSNNIDQAVIRLDPPNLGRVEIAIRHSAGSLEVTLSATHHEVLRELHAVSDTLRNDLAQRQYSEVAVTVASAPRNAAATPFAGDPQGRGRQGGQEQEQSAPGLALADADGTTSAFSLNGRE